MATSKKKVVKKTAKKAVKKDVGPPRYICTDQVESEILQNAGVLLMDVQKSEDGIKHTFETTEADVKAIMEVK